MFGYGGSDDGQRGFAPQRILRFIGLSFAFYLVLLLPWRFIMPGYAALLAPPVRGVMALVGTDVGVAAEGPYLRYARAYPAVRVPLAADQAALGPLLSWWDRLAPGLLLSVYRVERTRAFVNVERADVHRFTLEFPLFLALLLALPGVPWRRRLAPLAIGVGGFFAIHVFLASCTGFGLKVREGALGADAAGAIVDRASNAWQQLPDRYQFVGPVLALTVVVAMILAGLFDPKTRTKHAPTAGSPDEEQPSS